MAAVVDQRGEAWDQAVWLVKNDQQEGDVEGTSTTSSTAAAAAPGGTVTSVSASAGDGASHEEMFAVRKIWEFVVGFARRANVEWRIVISKLGTMDESELAGLSHFFLQLLPLTRANKLYYSSMVRILANCDAYKWSGLCSRLSRLRRS